MMGDRHLRTLALDASRVRLILAHCQCSIRFLRIPLEHAAILLDPSEAQGVIARLARSGSSAARFEGSVFKSSVAPVESVRHDDGFGLGWRWRGHLRRCAFLLLLLFNRPPAQGPPLPRQHDRRIPQGSYQSRLRRPGEKSMRRRFLRHPAGNGVAQVRRVIAHTRNYVDLMPISSVWAGESKNPSALMPPNSPPLLYAATQGVYRTAQPARLRCRAHAFDGPTGQANPSVSRFSSRSVRYPNHRSSLLIKALPVCTLQGRRRPLLRHRRRRAVFQPSATSTMRGVRVGRSGRNRFCECRVEVGRPNGTPISPRSQHCLGRRANGGR